MNFIYLKKSALGLLASFFLLSNSAGSSELSNVSKEDIIHIFAGKRFFYINLKNRKKAIIGEIRFNKKMDAYRYRELIGGHRKGRVTIAPEENSFLLTDLNRSVEILRKKRRYIKTDYRALLRFYHREKPAQAFLEHLGYDVTPPFLTLEGSRHLQIEQYQPFIDPGFSAIDNHDGPLRVTISGQVDTTEIGTYTLIYRAKDSAGNITTRRRTVEVIPSNAEIHWVTTLAEFRQALEDAALNGLNDVILLGKGIYRTTDDGQGPFRFQDDEEQNLTITAAPGFGSDDVILDGNDSTQVLRLDGNRKAVFSLAGLSIVHGRSARRGAGVEADNDTRIIRCRIEENELTAEGVNGGGFAVYGDVILSECIVHANKTRSRGSGGGGHAYRSIRVWKSSITQNHASEYGGGLYCGSIQMIDSIVFNNDVSSQISKGGGFYTTGSSFLIHTLVQGNHAPNTAAYGAAGFWSSSLTMIDSEIDANDAGYNGGGFVCKNDAEILRSRIHHNRARGKGGGFYIGGTLKADRLLVEENNASGAGGAFYTKRCLLANSYIHANNSDTAGDSLYAEYAYVMNSTFMQNDGSAYTKYYAAYINDIFDPDQEGWNIVADGKAWILNSYIDYTKIKEKGDIYKKNNLLPSSVGPLYLRRNLIPTAASPILEKGIRPDDPLFARAIDSSGIEAWLANAQRRDLRGRKRWKSIDLGAINISR